jgi:EAL domain-containing protein (putative c-di-GMP-specific phosphodiesterase class I)
MLTFSPLVGLSNILTPFAPYIAKLIAALEQMGAFTGESRSLRDWHELKLAVLQTVLGAENVVLWQGETTESIQPILQSNLAADNGSESLRWVLNARGTARIFAPESCGVCLPEAAGGVVLVPVVSDFHVMFLALHGVRVDALQEPLACLVSQFYQIDGDGMGDAINVEGQLIDAWKRRFQFMPSSLYERRFTLFCERLKQMQVFFQPIVQLRPLRLSGWEALARDRIHHQTPVDLFRVAELWGRQFIIELDLHFLVVATETYREQTERYGIAPLPLSINVYPDSLLQKSYLTCLQRLVSHGVIESKNLVLEISEKQEIVHTPTWGNHSPVNHSFRNKLKEIARSIPQIRFAIDDYGSNHATVSRLLGLCLDYVKIDREVLYCDPDACRTVLRFIQNLMIEQGCFQPYIVMEGVDTDCPIKIGELSSLGISHIQGFGVGTPRERIYGDLSPELREYLAQQLQTSVNMLPTF